MVAVALLQQNVAIIYISLSRPRARTMSTSSALTKYKQQSQRNIRDLYDKVQESLITTGFGKVLYSEEPLVGRRVELQRLKARAVGSERNQRETNNKENRESDGVHAHKVETTYFF